MIENIQLFLYEAPGNIFLVMSAVVSAIFFILLIFTIAYRKLKNQVQNRIRILEEDLVKKLQEQVETLKSLQKNEGSSSNLPEKHDEEIRRIRLELSVLAWVLTK